MTRGAGPASAESVGGLGLSVLRWGAELDGGVVRLVEPEGPSAGGARFEVRLPLPAGAPAEARE